MAEAEPAREIRTPKAPQQARGARRVAALLDAAAAEIARVGVDGLTMNAVAARAATSPGSLYQFFPNREALLDALAARFDEELSGIADATAAALGSAPPDDPGAAVLAVLQPFSAFYAANPAYLELVHAATRPGRGTPREDALDARVAQVLVAALRPHAAPNQVPRLPLMAQLMIEASHAALASMRPLGEPERAVVMGELEAMLVAYAGSLGQGGGRGAHGS